MLLDEVKKIVDVLVGHEWRLVNVEEEILVQQVDAKVEILGGAHANVADLERLLQLVHHYLAISPELRVVQTARAYDGLALRWFLQELRA